MSKRNGNPIGQSAGGAAVLLCDCHGTLSEKLDFDQLRQTTAALPGILCVRQCSSLCGNGDRAELAETLRKESVTALVFAGCERTRFERQAEAFRETVGLAPGTSIYVNIRDLCALAFADRAHATAKAREMLANALRRSNRQEPLEKVQLPVCTDALVLGDGWAAVKTALDLAERGHKVTLAHAGADLLADGFAQITSFLAELAGEDDGFADGDRTKLLDAVRCESKLRALPRTVPTNCRGQVGDFRVTLHGPDGTSEVRTGAIVLALTALPVLPIGSGGNNGAIVDLYDLIARLRSGEAIPPTVALIMDVGVEQGRFTSLCVLALARHLARGLCRRVRIYCRHVRVAAPKLDALYRTARDAGVEFFRFDSAPECHMVDGRICLRATDAQLGQALDDSFDLVVNANLAPALAGNGLFKLLGIGEGRAVPRRLNSVWHQPCETNRPGIFAIGLAGPDLDPRELATEVRLTAHRVHDLLAESGRVVLGDAADVDPEKCVACLTCVRLCPHRAIEFDPDEEAAAVSTAACQRCGICAAECPAGAIQLPRFTDAQIAAELEERPRVTVFVCANSAYPAALQAAADGEVDWAEFQLIEVPCAGKVDPRQILHALERGADRVLLLGCNPENCRYFDGPVRAAKRIERIQSMLTQAGLDASRVRQGSVIAAEHRRLAEVLMNRE